MNWAAMLESFVFGALAGSGAVIVLRWRYFDYRITDRFGAEHQLIAMMEDQIANLEHSLCDRGIPLVKGRAEAERARRVEEGRRILFPSDDFPQMYGGSR